MFPTVGDVFKHLDVLDLEGQYRYMILLAKRGDRKTFHEVTLDERFLAWTSLHRNDILGAAKNPDNLFARIHAEITAELNKPVDTPA